MEITFMDKLRDEKKFPSLAALKEQIRRDVLEAESRF
jgi:FAD synthase